MQADQSGTLFVGVHGVLELAPWLRPEPAEEDGFSLVGKRAAMLGLTVAGSLSSWPGQWDHHEAGGDWTADGAVRELAWLQAGLPGDVRRVPLFAAVTVLADAVRRVGRARFTGIHAIVPMHLAGDARVALADAADWFALADPAARVELTVTVAADAVLDLPARAAALTAAATDRAHGQLAVSPTGSPPVPSGVASPLAVQFFVPAGWTREQAFTCRVREWSPEVAAWVTEIFTDALREIAPTGGPAFVTVSHVS